MSAYINTMLIFIHKLQHLHIALHSLSEHHKTFRSEFSFHFKMHLNNYIQLIFLCVVNIIFTFSGIVSNTLAIVSIWKSSQLRKKIMPFHDHGVVVFRFGHNCNELSQEYCFILFLGLGRIIIC